MGLLLALWLGVAGAEEPFALCYPSGFRVAVVEREGPPLVGLGMVIRGGSSVEQPGEEGVAHLLEHLWFRSVREDGRVVNEILETEGAQTNAYTNKDETVFITIAHRRSLSTLLALGAQRVLDPLGDIPVDVVERERDVVRNELRERFDGGGSVVTTLMSGLVEPDDPYAHPVGGTDESVRALTWQTAQAYADRQYDPGYVSLLLAGDIDLQTIRQTIRSAMPRRMLADPRLPRDIRARDCTHRFIDEPELASVSEPSEWTERFGQVDEPTAFALWPVSRGFDAAETARVAAVMASIELDKAGYGDADCAVLPAQRLNVLACAVPLAAAKGDPKRYVRRALRPLERLWRDVSDGSSPKHFYFQNLVSLLGEFRTRDRATLSERLDLSPDGFLVTASSEFHWSNRLTPPTEVQATDLSVMVRAQDELRTVLVRPSESSFAGATIHGERGRTTPDDGAEREALDLATLRRLVVPPPLEELQVDRLPGGLDVYVVPIGEAPSSHLSMVYPADDSWNDTSTRIAAASSLPEPEDQLSDAEWSSLWRKGVVLDWEVWATSWGLEATAPKLSLASYALSETMPPPVRLAKRRAVRKKLAARAAWRAVALQEPDMLAERVRWAALADGLVHPTLDDAGFEAMLAVGRGPARRFAKAFLQPSRGTLLAVSNEDPERTMTVLRKAFNRVQEPGEDRRAVSLPEPRAALERSVTLIHDDSTVQASVALACHIVESKSTATWLIQRWLEKRLNEELRNDLGATYGVHAARYPEAHGLTLEIHTQVPPARSADAVAALLGGIEALHEGSVAATALDDVKRTVAMSTVTEYQSGYDILEFLRGAVVWGRDPTTYDLAQALFDTTPEDLQAAVAPCRGFESVTVVGDVATTGKALPDATTL